MDNCFKQCRIPGCGTLVPTELEMEGYCVPHFLSAAESACAEMRRETATGTSDDTRRAEVESYVAAAAVKLALVGTGSARLSDEIKKRVLTTFLTLMILRENLDRAGAHFSARPRTNGTNVNVASVAARA
jgi:hypothetical protein